MWQQIATYLIIYRVAEGRAWQRNTLALNTTLPPISFGAPPQKSTITQLSDIDASENSSLGDEKTTASPNRTVFGSHEKAEDSISIRSAV